MARALADADTRDLLPEIRIPTLLLWGEADARSPLNVAHAMKALIPEARLSVIPERRRESNPRNVPTGTSPRA
jgi:pimeloyl-ACP methyl ester carboxylesterase